MSRQSRFDFVAHVVREGKAMTPDTIDTPDESLCLLLGTDSNGSEVQAPRCTEWPACVCGGPEGEQQ